MERTKTDFQGAQLSFDDEIIVDGFCGGGGWSTGFELAVGRPVDIGINHDAAAIAMHRKNHPYTRHYNANIWDVDPREACAGRPVGWAHFSPDCKHFSRAKGGKPVSKKIRGLAWVVIKWAGTVFPRIISMENVIEFTTWGPLVAARDKKSGRVLKQDGSIAEPGERVPVQEQKLVPDKRRAGKTFRRFVGELRALGYTVEWRELTACDYGAPTTRRRFFLLARRDGKPIVWPEPTHGDPDSGGVLSGRLQPWRTAAEIIDWSKPCPSIFERKKPLAENTMRRIAKGIQKFVLDNPEPFIVQVNHGGTDFRGQTAEEPLPTITAKHGFGVVAPIVTKFQQNSIGQSPAVPLDTVMPGATRFAEAAATLIQYHTERADGECRGQDVRKPLQTVDTSNRYGLAAAMVVQLNNHCIGQTVQEPLHTVTAGAGHFADVRAFLIKYYGDGNAHSVNKPLDTITTRDRFGLVTVKGVQYQIVDIGLRMLTPRELYNAQGFPPDYEMEVDDKGRAYPKHEQVARCGNAVPPQFATALARANAPEWCKGKEITTMAQWLDHVAV